VEKQIRSLCEAGLDIAIDDFGTGYSSLGRLLDLPISILKLVTWRGRATAAPIRGEGTED